MPWTPSSWNHLSTKFRPIAGGGAATAEGGDAGRGAADSPQLSAAYAKLRASKAKGLFILSLVMVLALLTVAVTSVSMHVDNNTLGAVLGAGFGILVGIAGATLGVVMGLRRMRINRMLNELNHS